MAYRQDETPRICEICQNQIEKYTWMLDLFRKESSVEGSNLRVVWVHESCAQSAIQTWLMKKRAKAEASRQETEQQTERRP